MPTESLFVHASIDIASKKLDVFCPGLGCKAFENNLKGINAIVRELKCRDVTHLAFESTGHYGELLKEIAWENNMKLFMLNPMRVRHFARSCGHLAKTDKIDSKVIYDYAKVQGKDLKELKRPSKAMKELRDCVARRQDLVAMLTTEKNRSHVEVMSKAIKGMILKNIKRIEKDIGKVDKMIADIIRSDDELAQKAKTIQDRPGVGPVVTAILLAQMPELGKVNRKQVAALAGVAPMANDSGSMHGKRYIQCGRFDVRRALYMATVTAIRYDGKLKDRYNALIAKGKATKVAIVACMRNLLIEINVSLRNMKKED